MLALVSWNLIEENENKSNFFWNVSWGSLLDEMNFWKLALKLMIYEIWFAYGQEMVTDGLEW